MGGGWGGGGEMKNGGPVVIAQDSGSGNPGLNRGRGLLGCVSLHRWVYEREDACRGPPASEAQNNRFLLPIKIHVRDSACIVYQIEVTETGLKNQNLYFVICKKKNKYKFIVYGWTVTCTCS